MTPRTEYRALLTIAKKQLGGLTPGLDPIARDLLFEEIYKPISGKRGYSWRNVNALKKRIDERREMSERKRKAFDKKKDDAEEKVINAEISAKIEIENFLKELKTTSENFETDKGKRIGADIYNYLNGIIQRSIKKNGYAATYKKLKKDMEELKNKMNRLVCVLYKSGGYKESTGRINFTAWVGDLQSISLKLGVSNAGIKKLREDISDYLTYDSNLEKAIYKKMTI